MNTHPYVRAYIAGIAVPTLFLLVVLSAFIVFRLILKVPIPIERVIPFPMAGVPNIFGLWNMLYLRVHPGRQWPIGLHGAILPFLLAPTAALVGSALGVIELGPSEVLYFGAVHLNYGLLAMGICVVAAIYYLVWKYFVNFFNGVVGIA